MRRLEALPDNAPMVERVMTGRFGEVVEASLERLVAQCHRLYDSPPLGTLVRAGESNPVYAVVAGVATASLDPTRPVIARGANLESEAEVLHEHPQLEKLLRTTVTLTVVGHAVEGEVHQYLPPSPPRIHAFVYPCSPEEVRRFTQRLDFLPLLAGTVGQASDDVLAAMFREAAIAYDQPREFLVRAGRAVASLMGSDTSRLVAILRRLPL